MFDEIIPQPAIKCPNCDAETTCMQTKDLANAMDTYVEGQRQMKVHSYRDWTSKEKAEYDKTYPHMKGMYLPILQLDENNWRTVDYPKYTSVYAYERCSCDKMIGQVFRFDETGLLHRYEEPTIEG